jgi:hypothetical protein
VTFTEFDGGPGRATNIYWIAIIGRSTWTGPKGLRLGMSLAAVEKINAKPFKLQGFDQNNSPATIDRQDGALASLPARRPRPARNLR